VDESFIDFYDRNNTVETEVYFNKNLIVVRSLSKDFGIAGLRLGYAVCNPSLNKNILSKYGLCWNINGLGQFFLETLSKPEFNTKYKTVRETYLKNKNIFYNDLKKLNMFTLYDSNANFFIIDCGENINKIFTTLLFEHGVYTRILNDKLHLDDTFLRVACGTLEDNQIVYESLNTINKNL